MPNPTVKEPEKYLCTMVGFQGGNGSGEVCLRSSDPNDTPTIDPNYLSHPFDRRVAIEAVREALELQDIPSLAKARTGYAAGPKGRTDEDIWVRSASSSSTHALLGCFEA